ncbi:hypothetical protein O1C12_003572 [Vibrio cholerae]|nr:hypothetical protein [Vibrio cholerae]
MKTLILKTAASQKSFTYNDYEITNSDVGLASVKFTRNEEYVVIYLSNSTGNPIEKIEHRYAFSFKAIDKLETALYNSVQINNREFYVGQNGAALKEYVNSTAMPLSKSAKRVEQDVIASLVKSRNAAKQQPVTKSSSTMTRQQQIEAFVNKHKPQSKDVVAEQVYAEIRKQKAEQTFNRITCNDKGVMCVDMVELNKAADVQLSSCLSFLKSKVDVTKLNSEQQIDFANYLVEIAKHTDVLTLQSLTNKLIAKLTK